MLHHMMPRPEPRATLLAALTLMLAACGSGTPASSAATLSPSEGPSVMDAAALTAYDPAAPLNVSEVAEPIALDDGITVHDLAWDSPLGGRVSAWLVLPAGEGPFPGIVYLHGSETGRNDFVDEAIAMAHGGAASLVLDAPFSRTGDDQRAHLSDFGKPDMERDMTAQAVVDARRAYDVFAERGDIDMERLAFVGHSWGASLGVVLAAVDPRPGSLVLLSGRPSWTGFLRSETDGSIRALHNLYGDEKWNLYLDTMAPLDAMAEVANVDGDRLYFQYGETDDVVPPEVASELTDAASGARLDLYDSGHALDDTATADRVAWLVDRLGMEPIPAAAVDGVGLPDQEHAPGT